MFVLFIQRCRRADELAGGQNFYSNPGYHGPGTSARPTLHAGERDSFEDAIGVNDHPRALRRIRLDSDPFDFVQRERIPGAIVELRRPGRLVRGDELRVFDRAAVLEVGGDPRRPERVAAY